MIILDTCILIFDTLQPEKLTRKEKETIITAKQDDQLYCSDISLNAMGWSVVKRGIENRVCFG